MMVSIPAVVSVVWHPGIAAERPSKAEEARNWRREKVARGGFIPRSVRGSLAEYKPGQKSLNRRNPIADTPATRYEMPAALVTGVFALARGRVPG
jgi:hypothetical protein